MTFEDPDKRAITISYLPFHAIFFSSSIIEAVSLWKASASKLELYACEQKNPYDLRQDPGEKHI